MEQWLYDSLLSLSLGNEVCFEEIRGYRLWSQLSSWLKEHNVRYSVRCVGRGMRVDYCYKVDGRCLGKLSRVLNEVYKQILWNCENL